MMLFVHIDSSQLVSIAEVDGHSIWSFLYPINTPVPLFLLLSGYGFYYVCQKEKDLNYWFRVAKLFIHFWIVLLIFIPIAQHSINFDAIHIISNVSAWYVSWNGTCWFIFPYVILALAYRHIYDLGIKIGFIWLIGVSLCLYLIAGFLISKFSINYETSSPICYNLLYLLFSQFPFVLGMCMNKYGILNKEKCSSWTVWGGQLLYSWCFWNQ